MVFIPSFKAELKEEENTSEGELLDFLILTSSLTAVEKYWDAEPSRGTLQFFYLYTYSTSHDWWHTKLALFVFHYVISYECCKLLWAFQMYKLTTLCKMYPEYAQDKFYTMLSICQFANVSVCLIFPEIIMFQIVIKKIIIK